MHSRNKDIFCGDPHWLNWKRVLVRGGGDYAHQVEIPLTPLNHDSAVGWAQIAEVLITRKDIRTLQIPSSSHGLLWTHDLSEHAVMQMEKHLGREKTDLLLHADLYPLIDWDLYGKLEREYKYRVPFELCRKRTCYHFSKYIQNKTGAIEYTQIPEEEFKDLVGDGYNKDALMIGGVSALLTRFGIQVYGMYDYKTNCIFFYVTHSHSPQGILDNKEIHSSQFIHRGLVGWDNWVKVFIDKILQEGRMSVDVYMDINKMIDVAKVNLALITHPTQSPA